MLKNVLPPFYGSSVLHIFHCTCEIRPYFYFRSKIWRHHCILRPRVLIGRGNFGDSHTFKADIGLLIFAWIFRTSWLKMGVFGSKTGEGVLTPMNSFLLSGVLTYLPILVKIFQELRPWECGQTDTQIHWQTQTLFIICPLLYAIAMGR